MAVSIGLFGGHGTGRGRPCGLGGGVGAWKSDIPNLPSKLSRQWTKPQSPCSCWNTWADAKAACGRYQTLAFELVKKLVLAWDPDYTKLTPAEKAELDKAAAEMEAGNYVADSAIDWE